MAIRRHAILLGMTALAFGAGACHRSHTERPSPLAVGRFAVPDDGATETTVLALNGPPQHRESVDAMVLWVYSRTAPGESGLRSTTANVWFRDGVVVRTEAREAVAVPNPTFPGEPRGGTGSAFESSETGPR